MLWIFIITFQGVTALQLHVQENASPFASDIRYCTSYKLSDSITYHIKHFTPTTRDHAVHHVALGMCDEPGSYKSHWNCDDRRERSPNTLHSCKGYPMILLYASAYGTGNLTLPEEHASQVGKDTQFKYLVLQTHYGSVKKGQTYHSGVLATYEAKPKLDGNTLTFDITNDDTSNILPPHQESIVEAYREAPVAIQPMFYHIHAHDMGRNISVYVVKRRSSDSGLDTWVKLGKRDPRLPQDYIPVETNVTAEVGDGFAVRCTYYNDKDQESKIGLNEEEEMCKVLVTGWHGSVDETKLKVASPNMNKSWKGMGLSNIPEDA